MSQSTTTTELEQTIRYNGSLRSATPDDIGPLNGRVRPNGPELMRLRKARSLSRERLAAMTGLKERTIRTLEEKVTCRCNPLTITTLAAFYDVEPYTLLAEQDNRPVVRLLTTSREIIETNTRIVASAKTVLACIGSRSRDPEYLRLIEATLEVKPTLIHYRTMTLPPFKKEFQDHLFKVLKTRDPLCRAHGHKTTHIGIYDNLLRQPEASICANETMALVVLPSPKGVGEYNAALLVQDASMAEGYVNLAKNLYQMGRPVETEQEIRKLGLVKDGVKYV